MATKRNRLPTLNEVLRRSTLPPVDLYCYYIFLQRHGLEDSLDFWLDVAQHENLCRAYFKDLRKAGRNVKEDWPAYYDLAKKRGSMFNGRVNGIVRGEVDEVEDEKRENEYLLGGSKEGRRSSEDVARRSMSMSDTGGMSYASHSHSHSHSQSQSHSVDPRFITRTPSPSASQYPPRSLAMTPTLQKLYPHDNLSSRPEPTIRGRKSSVSQRRASTPVQPYIPRNSAITRLDLLASAERIFARYLLPGSTNEIYLPPSLRITSFPLSSASLPAVESPQSEFEATELAKIPDMFNFQKEYVYRMLEGDSFPRFLRERAFGNLTGVGAMGRLGVGLVGLWVAFSVAFSLIFLDTKPKAKRLWIILPFSLSILFLLSHSYALDPLLILFLRSETTPFRTIQIKEPYVKKLLIGRSIWVTLLTTILTAVVTVIFWAVPGKRL